MEHIVSSAADLRSSRAYVSGNNEAKSSGVSWSAVIGGAFVAAALSLILTRVRHRGRLILRFTMVERERVRLDD